MITDHDPAQIIPLYCLNAWGCFGFEGWLLDIGVPILILVAGALVMNRFVSMPFVALVAFATFLAIRLGLYFSAFGVLFWPAVTQGDIWVWYFIMLAIAVVAHGAKRGALAVSRNLAAIA